MKNQYVGDIGDFGKYALLRAFAEEGIKLGVNWYLTEDDNSNDGKFTDYLRRGGLRRYSPFVYDRLREIVGRENKSVRDVQESGLLPAACFYGKTLPTTGSPAERRDARKRWFEESVGALSSAEFIFMDPDNGLLESNDATKARADRYVLPEEVEAYYQAGKNVVYYCHKGRRTYELWQRYKSIMFERIPTARPAVLTYHKGTQRSYVFLMHEEDFGRYQKIIEGFLKVWYGIFSEENHGLAGKTC